MREKEEGEARKGKRRNKKQDNEEKEKRDIKDLLVSHLRKAQIVSDQGTTLKHSFNINSFCG